MGNAQRHNQEKYGGPLKIGKIEKLQIDEKEYVNQNKELFRHQSASPGRNTHANSKPFPYPSDSPAAALLR